MARSHVAIRRAVAEASAAARLATPVQTQTLNRVVHLSHPMLTRKHADLYATRLAGALVTRTVVTGNGDEETVGVPTSLVNARIAAVVSHAARREAWRRELGHDPTRIGATPLHRMLGHPLTAHMAARGLALDATHAAEFDMLRGTAVVAECDGAPVTAHVGMKGTRLEIPVDVPNAVATGAAGRRLADVLRLPECGSARVDGAVVALVVDRGERWHISMDGVAQKAKPDGQWALVLHLRPTTWITLADPPPGERVRFHLDHPLVA